MFDSLRDIIKWVIITLLIVLIVFLLIKISGGSSENKKDSLNDDLIIRKERIVVDVDLNYELKIVLIIKIFQRYILNLSEICYNKSLKFQDLIFKDLIQEYENERTYSSQDRVQDTYTACETVYKIKIQLYIRQYTTY